MKDIPELEGINFGPGFVRHGQLCLRFDTKSLKGLKLLQEIGEAIKRPVDAFGNFDSEMAYLWIEIPLTNIRKSHYFGNMPPERKKK